MCEGIELVCFQYTLPLTMKARGQLETADTCIDSVRSGIHYCLHAKGAFELRKEIFLTNWAQSLSTLTRHPAVTTFHCGVESSSHRTPCVTYRTTRKVGPESM